MRLLINSNDRISGVPTNFNVKLNFLPEDMNKKYKVYIQQAVVCFGTSFTDARMALYISSKSLTPYNDYNTRYNNSLCLVTRDVNNLNFKYENNTMIENFKINKVQGELNFQIRDLNNDSLLSNLAIYNTSIILNLIEE
jgi:hypothetical protein